MVPREPISQGRFVRKYAFSVEWKRIYTSPIST